MKLTEPQPAGAPGNWPTAMATVTSCRFDAGVGRAVTFGLPTLRRFRIEYNYFAAGEVHTGTLRSAEAMPQGTLFPLRYDPALTHRHSVDGQPLQPASRRTLLLIGLAGSVVLSLAWAAVLHGCS